MVSASKDNNMLVTIFLIIIFANIIKALFLRPKYGRNIRERFERWHWKKAAKSFGINERKLKKMSKDEIKSAYRKKAKEAHPDHGGDAETFNMLNEAYQFAYGAAA